MIERGILYIVDASSNSVKQHITVLLKYLNRARYKPYLAISDDSYVIEHLKGLNVDYIVVPEIETANKLNVGSVAKEIVEFANQYTVNLVHSHGYQACFVATQVAKILGVPHINTVHAVGGLESKKKGFFGVQNEKVIELPNQLIAVSEEIKNRVESKNKVALIYNGIETNRFEETLDTEHLFRELDLEKDNRLVGTITKLALNDDFKTFIEAAKTLIKNDSKVHIAIAGDGPDSEQIKQYIKDKNLEKNIHVLGFRRDVAHVLKSLDVVVIVNSEPGIPLVLLEALASNRPIVSVDTPGIREVVAESNVSFVKAGDAEGLAKAIEELLKDRDTATKKANEGKKVVEAKFTVDHMIKPTQSLYLQVAG